MSAVLYSGEASGARVFRHGTGLTGIGQTLGSTSDYQLDLTTWDAVPATEVGDNVFRSVDVTFTCTNGYHVGITPIVDGVAQPEQAFNGAGTGEVQAQAFFYERGARIAARFRTLQRTGDLELHTIAASYVTIRATP